MHTQRTARTIIIKRHTRNQRLKSEIIHQPGPNRQGKLSRFLNSPHRIRDGESYKTIYRMENLTYLNWLNLVGYIVNVLFTFFAERIFNLEDVAAISEKYQTILTPTGLTFAIWGVIFLSQGIFAIVQMLRPYRSIEVVQDEHIGVYYWYFITCMAQSLWVILFGKELILLSTIAMFVILYSLLRIVQNQNNENKDDISQAEFWLLVFPFQIHCGWIFCATVLNLNVMLIDMGADATAQIISAVLCLLGLGTLVVSSLMAENGAIYTIPSVFAWATLGIFLELRNPKALVMDTFSTTTIQAFKVLGIAFSVVCTISILTVAIIEIIERRRIDNKLDASRSISETSSLFVQTGKSKAPRR